jgi:CBS domain-containing protein
VGALSCSWRSPALWPSEVSAVLGYLAWANLVLAIFNLVPGFPLDGGRVLRALLWMIFRDLRRATHIASNVGNGVGYLFMVGGALEWVLGGAVFQGIWLIFIGWFLHKAATASYQQVVLDKLLLGVEVRNVMDSPPSGIEPDTPLQVVIYRHMISANQRSVPVMKSDGTFEGLLTLGDVQKIPNNDWPLVPAERVMVPLSALQSVRPEDNLKDALRILAENDYHQLPVLVGDRLVGMLDRGHVMQYMHVRGRLEAARQGEKSADAEKNEPTRRAG